MAEIFYPVLLSILLLFPLYLIVNLMIIAKNRNRNQPPGPPKLPIIGNIHQLGKLPHRSLYNLSKKYGPIMLLQLGNVPTIIISSPELAKEVLKTYDLECCSRPPIRGPGRLSYNHLDLAFSPYNDYWREMRKVYVMELFCAKKVKSFTNIRKEYVASLIEYISSCTSGSVKKPVDINERVFYMLDNVISKIVCGQSYDGKQFENKGFQRHEDVIRGGMEIFWGFSWEDFIPYVGWIADVLTGHKARRDKVFLAFDAFFQRVIDEHLDPHRQKPERGDTLDNLLELLKGQDEGGLGLTHVNIKGVLMNLFLGSIDTSSVTMVWAMSELMRNPRVMEKLQAEIRSNIKKKLIVEESDCKNLNYLQMVIKETLRLHPPGVLLVPHFSMTHFKLGGYDVYPNTRIHVNVFSLGRDPKTWENPEEFYPERFDNNPLDFKGQHFEFLPFGAGRRICPAIEMATTTIELVLANLLYHFDWELPDGMNREDLDMEEENGITTLKKIPLVLVPTKYKGDD